MVEKSDIEKEAEEIKSAPAIQPLPPIGRCAFCGRLSHDLTLVERHGEFERYKCHVCVGAIHE